MEKIFDLLLNSFDFGYMIAINILAYLAIKIVDELNGKKKVPAWQKRLITFISGIVVTAVLYFIGEAMTTVYLYSFIASMVSWDVIFKPLIKNFKHLDYK